MTDILRGLAGGGWLFLFSWVLPGGIVIGTFALMVLPYLAHLPLLRNVAMMGGAQKLLVVAGSSLVVGALLQATSTSLYRLMEGYSWPSWLRQWSERRQHAKKRELQRQLDQAPDQG
jgi:hypothetical protein